MKSMRHMEAMQQTRPPQSFRGETYSGRTALFVGLCFGVASGMIDAVYFFLLSHKHFSLGKGIPPYLWPAGDNAPYFNVFWTFLYSIPTYILLSLVFLLVGFITTYTTR